ncbi:hypothetical protein [Lysobacter sp. CA199]|uniref:hypothetical protein n=1 Tax=Lysobacter sp. CA199 TaxID=3455608 RepID=UPI003F8D599F
MLLSRYLNRNVVGLGALLLATIALYWIGLKGPFLFDDGWNLAPIEKWRLGKATFQEVVFGDRSLLLARPVAMASFVLTSSFGPGTFPYKLGNLVIHLLCGVLVWVITRRISRQDVQLNPNANLVALIVAAFWLLHPLHVSTVLYAVQRMAQLASLFVLASCWTYLIARQQASQGLTRKAALHLFLTFPLLVAAGLLSKQNAAVAPLLCLVIEVAYFRGQAGKRLITTFFALSLGIPALATAIFLAARPYVLTQGYTEWTFTLSQRLLTQPHALADYLSMLVLPRGPQMGLYTDDFPVSTGILAPPSTLISILSLAAFSIVAILLRRRAPIVFAGWFFFLGAHIVESSILPLEMYYEHRNYLPSVGIFWIIVGGLASAPPISTNVLTPRQLGLIGATVFAAILAFATFGRVLIWQDKESIFAQGLTYHPQSLRAVFDSSMLALEKKQFDTAKKLTAQLAVNGENPQYRALSNIFLISIDCEKNGDADPAYLKAAQKDVGDRVTVLESEIMRYLTTIHAEKGGCGKATASDIADTFSLIIERSRQQPDSATPKWTARFYAAQMFARAERWEEAEHMSRIAWEQGRTISTGSLHATLLMSVGRTNDAHALYRVLAKRVPAHDLKNQAELASLRTYFQEQGHPIP